MAAADPTPQSAPARHPFAAVSGTLLVQAFASLILNAPSILAPAVAPMLGFRPEQVGLFVGIAYLAAMLSGLSTGAWVARYGAVRLSQAAMLACALGMFISLSGLSVLLILAALLAGAGYGVINPAASELLVRHSPPANRGLFFSIKQTGVPLGVALAGLLMPLGLALIGWHGAIATAACACLILGAGLWPLARRVEPERFIGASNEARNRKPRGSDAARLSLPASSLRHVLRDPPLRRLSLTSFTFAFTQLCFLTFLVSFLKLEVGLPLSQAAAILAGAQLVSTIARIGWGHVGDRWIAPARLLGLLGVTMAVACAALALLAPTGWVALWMVTAACAATAVGWNGVFFAELARQAGPKELATLAGASQFFTFAGSMTGPVVFAELIRSAGGYANAYLILAPLPLIAGLAMLRADAGGPARPPASSGAPDR